MCTLHIDYTQDGPPCQIGTRTCAKGLTGWQTGKLVGWQASGRQVQLVQPWQDVLSLVGICALLLRWSVMNAVPADPECVRNPMHDAL